MISRKNFQEGFPGKISKKDFQEKFQREMRVRRISWEKNWEKGVKTLPGEAETLPGSPQIPQGWKTFSPYPNSSFSHGMGREFPGIPAPYSHLINFTTSRWELLVTIVPLTWESTERDLGKGLESRDFPGNVEKGFGNAGKGFGNADLDDPVALLHPSLHGSPTWTHGREPGVSQAKQVVFNFFFALKKNNLWRAVRGYSHLCTLCRSDV